jgi:hypothetical protein
VHPAAVDALHAVRQRGPLLIATGRRLRSTSEPLAELGLHPPAVVFNGALLVDLGTGERLHQQTFSREQATKVLEAFAAVGLSPCVYVDHDEVEVYTGPSPDTHPDHLEMLGRWTQPADLETIVATLPVYAFALLGQATDRLQMVADLVNDLATVHINADRQNGGAAINVNPPEQSKWVAVEAYCRLAGLDPRAVLALGDGSNDVELLTRAAVALVPKDAEPAALACADHIIGRASDGGWAEVLDLL